MSEETPQAAQLPAGKIQQDFETAATRLSMDLVIDYNDIKGAYSSKPESLTRLFNAIKENRWERNWNIGYTLAGVIFLTYLMPLALIPAYFAYERHEKIKKAEKMIRAEIVCYKASLPAPGPVGHQ